MKILTIVMTHKEALPTVKRHLPIWENCPGKIVFVSPEDSKMNIPGPNPYNETPIGQAEHSGLLSALRITEIFKFALEYPEEWDHLLLMEYDSFALGLPKDVIPPPGGISSGIHPQNKPIKFKGKFWTHYPVLLTRTATEKILEALPGIKTNDRLYSDRFIGRAVELANIPVNNLSKKGLAYARNTIEQKHISQVREAAKNGCLFWHGVKSKNILDIILNDGAK